VAAAVERAMAQPGARQRRSIVRRYSWPSILEAIEDTIGKVVGR
jgi:hypothetical protein